MKRLAAFSLGALTLTGCNPFSVNSSSFSSTVAKARPYCSSYVAYPAKVSVSGRASYQYRANGNGPIVALPRPIRHAEVVVSDAEGKIVQCAETNESGEFALALAADSGTKTISIRSRANNAFNTAYVMKTYEGKEPYALEAVVKTNADTVGLELIATASGETLGGAFNILDRIYEAQKYLRAQTENCDVAASVNYFPNCAPFTTAPLTMIYWELGDTPGKYKPNSFRPNTPATYFDGDDLKGLFIQGGINGNVDKSDTDHFDDSVILHEYGHALEHWFGKSDSEGGSHTSNSIADPRLAWSEGWGNFFQAAVLGAPYYRDSYGNIECTGTTANGRPCSGAYFNEPLDPAPGDAYNDIVDTDGGIGEGNFREFSIARLLYDVVKPGGTSRFSEIWAAMNGMKNPSLVLRTVGTLHAIQQSSGESADWSSLRAAESQTASRSVYATPLASCASSNVSMNVRKTASDDGEFDHSDQFRNNDFYVLDHPGGPFNASLSWTGTGVVDLDLYVYRQNYVFGVEETMATYSNASAPGTGGNEQVSKTLAAGTYVINVQANTKIYGVSGTYPTSYALKIGNSPVCPAP